MILIPEGEFTMGRNPDSNDPAHPNEMPGSTVKAGPYYIDRIEVTVEAYSKFCKATGHKMPAPPPFDAKYLEKKDHPIMNVSWSDATAFAKWAGKRLPNEQEWEKAARGTDGRRYPWGAAYSQGTANLKESGAQAPAAAGWYAFDFSPYGVLDMAGNVPEWVDSDAGDGKKIVRGGGFQSTGDQATTTSRTPVPGELDPSAYTAIGFRCAASPEAALKLRGQ
jgi:formylglycine-generating enzyme required for sulfatase activity